MEPLEAFSVLAEYADKQHDFIVGMIGQAAVQSSLEMNALSTDALIDLSDEEFDQYMTASVSEQQPAHEDAFLDPYLEATIEFGQRVNTLFGLVDGYSLFSADEHGVIVHRVLTAPHESVTAIERLSISALDDELSIRKIKQVIGGPDSGTFEQVVSGEDEVTVHEVLERLARVNDALQLA